MRLVRLVMVVLGVVACAYEASAQMRLDVERCRAIADDEMRLRCYDDIRLPGPIVRAKYEQVDLAELEEFPLSYRGRLVEVTGWLALSRDNLLLKTSSESEASMPIDAESLSRHERQSLLAACGEGCEATVQGKVAPVNFVTGIIADTISPD
jgi:hypothetical protein